MPFQLGLNLPWLHYGGDFGANAWRPEGGVHTSAARGHLDDTLARVAGLGIGLIRWFVLCDGRAGVREDDRGRPLGLDDAARRDLDAALDSLARHRLRAMFVLLDFLLAAPRRHVDDVRLGGRRAWIADASNRDRLIERVLVPLVDRASTADVVHSWDLVNEPEWMTLGVGEWRPWRAVTRAATRAFLGDALRVLRPVTRRPFTVGLASSRGLDLVRDLGLDFYQVHWYDHVDGPNALLRPASAYGLDAPLWLGEFPTADSSQRAGGILEAVRSAGYAGALAWSFASRDRFSSAAVCENDVAEWGRRA